MYFIFAKCRDTDKGHQATQCWSSISYLDKNIYSNSLKLRHHSLALWWRLKINVFFFHFQKKYIKNYKRISLCLLQVSLCRGSGGGGVRINGIGGCWGLCFCDPCYQHFDEKIQMNGDKTSRDPAAASTSSVVGRRRLPQLWPQCWRRPMRSFVPSSFSSQVLLNWLEASNSRARSLFDTNNTNYAAGGLRGQNWPLLIAGLLSLGFGEGFPNLPIDMYL